jgi:hypothetical protein
MTDRDRTSDELPPRPQSEPDDSRESVRGKDVMRGRSHAGANIFNTERQQTLDRQRIAEHGGEPLDEAGEFVTDAEIEAREQRRAERNED